MALNDKRRRFVAEYLVDLNGTQAAIRAGYASRRADSQAYRMLHDPDVAAAVAEAQAARAAKVELKAERVLLEVARLALADPRKLFDAAGAPKDIASLDDDTAAAIVGLDVTELFEGRGEARSKIGLVKKYKLANKSSALELACKHLGLLKDRQDDGKGNEFVLGNMNAEERDIVRDAARRVLASRHRRSGPGG